MKKTAIIFPILALALPLSAQNLNPEVRVTNDYVTRLMDVNKKQLEMSVPDSMLKFDYHFDYSVFESPYKGAYEFSPYSVKVTPKPALYDGSEFYLRLGAGYALHPEMETVWAPVHKENFDLSVYADASGFAGSYRSLDPADLTVVKGSVFPGYDLGANVGTELRWNLQRARMTLNTGYQGFFTGANNASGTYTSAFADFDICSTRTGGRFLFYDLGASYRFLYDVNSGLNNVLVNEIDVHGTGAGVLGDYRIATDFQVGADGYNVGMNFTPRFEFMLGPVDMSAGVTLAYGDGFSIHPDVRASIDLFAARAQAYASVAGGQRLNSYSDLKMMDHRYTLAFGKPEMTKERLNAELGIRGSFGCGLQYDVNGGFQTYRNHAFYGISASLPAVPFISFADYVQASAGMLLAWKTERVDAQARFRFRYNLTKDFADYTFAPSMLSGGVKFTYNWNRRFYLGITADSESNRSATIPYIPDPLVVAMPWYVDLGVLAEYRFTHRWSAWLRGGNLLGMDIRTTPLYSPAGVIATAGFSLCL